MATALIILSLQILSSFGNAQELHQFEYEYHVLEKLIELQDKQKIMLDRIGQIDERVMQLTRNYDAVVGSFDALRDSVGGGSLYVRWGRTTCPGNGTELVYNGYAAGSDHGYTGGAAEYTCLPTDPEWGFYDDSVASQGYIFGGEYEFAGTGYFSHGGSMLQQDVPCALCRSSRSTGHMFPAKKVCPDGWTREYTGYLCSGHRDHPAASQYVCLDAEPETVKGGSANQNGILFYMVEARCGSLPCPPYVHERELTCSVCTK